ncbi:MAG: DUF2851 family protein [Flavobacteriaceae bacterium]|nr:DUF2851 family protein [Flavobacteriaceae bacterium]
MKEDFLHYIWKHQMFSNRDLVTTGLKKIIVQSVGVHNHNSGPDFFNAKIEIDNLVWAGNVEIHVKSSDWYLHKHERDVNYDTVVLHVVWNDDVEIFDKNNHPLPTIEIASFISKDLLENYYRLFSKKLCWIPCEKLIDSVDSFVVDNWKVRLYFDRLEAKSKLIDTLLLRSNNNYESVLFTLLMKNFGLKLNGDSFLNLANSIDFSIIRKEQNDVLKLNALLFGQAGFLMDDVQEGYHQELKKEYAYLQHKFCLLPIANGQFQFFKIRPSNFPTIRIAQIAAVYHQNQGLFSKLMNFTRLEEFYGVFNVSINEFWQTHYTFHKTSPKKVKRITKRFVDLLLINTIIPLKFNYLKSLNANIDEEFLNFLKYIKAEKNAIVSKFSELKIKANNAFDSQALLELKNNYCAKKRCLHCAIGNSLLKRA